MDGTRAAHARTVHARVVPRSRVCVCVCVCVRAQELGVVFSLVLAPTQFALFKAASEGALGARPARTLNVVTAAAIALLDTCGNSQVRAQEVLVSGVEGLPDTSRFEANTTAAFYTALLVAVVYLVQGLRATEEAV